MSAAPCTERRLRGTEAAGAACGLWVERAPAGWDVPDGRISEGEWPRDGGGRGDTE